MANLKRVELSNELMISLLDNVPKDSVITYCEKSRTGIVLYLHSQEFGETKEGSISDDLNSHKGMIALIDKEGIKYIEGE